MWFLQADSRPDAGKPMAVESFRVFAIYKTAIGTNGYWMGGKNNNNNKHLSSWKGMHQGAPIKLSVMYVKSRFVSWSLKRVRSWDTVDRTYGGCQCTVCWNPYWPWCKQAYHRENWIVSDEIHLVLKTKVLGNKRHKGYVNCWCTVLFFRQWLRIKSDYHGDTPGCLTRQH